MASSKRKAPTDSGNFVSEWFGHRVYPMVAATSFSQDDQQTQRCPFLSEATGVTQTCIKPESSKGICTISSVSNRQRQDWLVCPYRGLDHPLVDDVARRLFDVDARLGVTVVPGPSLADPTREQEFARQIASGHTGIVYLQSKLGGEISISSTERSPELSFDFTLVEIIHEAGSYRLGRYGILEVQTMDYHGSYRAAVNNLSDALRLHGSAFHTELVKNPRWLGERVEGPNIANVFKRTFYQMMLKFQIGADVDCGGCVLALPQSVWDSWQRHLGRPDLQARDDGTLALVQPGKALAKRIAAWIYVFDIEASAATTPNPIVLKRIIATDADAVAYYALKVAPQAAVSGTGSSDRVLASIGRRLIRWWPKLQPPGGKVFS